MPMISIIARPQALVYSHDFSQKRFSVFYCFVMRYEFWQLLRGAAVAIIVAVCIIAAAFNDGVLFPILVPF